MSLCQSQHAKLTDVLITSASNIFCQGEKALTLGPKRHRCACLEPLTATKFADEWRILLGVRLVFYCLQVDKGFENLYKGKQKVLLGDGFGKDIGGSCVHMSMFREKFSLTLTGLAYLLFHLRLGSDMGSTVLGTLYQLLLTVPYAGGFTYIIAVIFKRVSGGVWLPWDRLLRIFFTIGILFAFFFALYEYAGQGELPL